MDKQIQILILEDNSADFELIKRELRKSGLNFTVRWAQSKATFLAALDAFVPDLVLTDYALPGFDGMTALALSRQRFPEIPVVIVSGAIGEEIAIETLKAGATDYVLKGHLSRLGPVVLRALQEARQVTERKLAEEMILRSKEEWERTFDIIPDLIAILDNEQHILRTNRALAERLGLTPEECVGKICYQCVHALDRPPANCPHPLTLVDGQLHVAEVYEPRLGGHFLVSTNPLCNPQGQITGVVHVARDITEHKRAELALEQANTVLQSYAEQLQRSNQALEDFAFIVSHDLREPLRKIQAFGDQLASHASLGLDGQGQDYIRRMQNSAGRMQTMLDGLLEYSRISTQNQAFSRVDLNQVAADVLSDLEVRILQTDGQVMIGELSAIEANPVQIRQLLQNLMGNALKFHRPNVPPVVKVSCQPISNERIALVFEDNGIGFNMSDAKRLFSPFYRVHDKSMFEGSGMGLAICRKIAERHGGQITAQSISGQGSTFTVTLPVNQKGT